MLYNKPHIQRKTIADNYFDYQSDNLFLLVYSIDLFYCFLAMYRSMYLFFKNKK